MHIECGGHTTTVGRLRALLFLMTEVEEDTSAVSLCDPERETERRETEGQRERERERETVWRWREETAHVLCSFR